MSPALDFITPPTRISRLKDIPSEVLSMIFLHTLHTCDDPLSAISLPLDISHVCTRWRKIALCVGGLWTKIVVFFPGVDTLQRTRISKWLSRSKSYPLEILLDFRYPEWDFEDEGAHPFTGAMLQVILGLLLPHVERWKTFEMLTDTWEPIHSFLLHTTDVKRASKLQSVALSRCNAYFCRKGQAFEPEALKDPIPLFGGHPMESLRDVSLSGVHVDWAQCRWRNLLDLSFKFHAADVMPSLKDFYHMLASCLDLQSLSILGWGPHLPDDADSKQLPSSPSTTLLRQIITLPNVVRFSFGFVDVDYAIRLLSLFHLPSLSQFELQDIHTSLDPHLDPLDATPVMDFLAASSMKTPQSTARCYFPLGQVQSLEIESLRSTEDSFSRFLGHFKALRRLCLADADSNLLGALHPSGDSSPRLPGPLVVVEEGRERRRSSFASVTLTPLCPDLVDMVCRRVDFKCLSALVEARCKADSGVRALRKVEIELEDSGLEDDWDWEEEGSSFTLTEEDREVFLKSGVDLLVRNSPERDKDE